MIFLENRLLLLSGSRLINNCLLLNDKFQLIDILFQVINELKYAVAPVNTLFVG